MRYQGSFSYLHRALLHGHELPAVVRDVVVAPDLERDFYGALAVKAEEHEQIAVEGRNEAVEREDRER